jgi:hypothetical protein
MIFDFHIHFKPRKGQCAYDVKINAYVQNPQTNANIAHGTGTGIGTGTTEIKESKILICSMNKAGGSRLSLAP